MRRFDLVNAERITIASADSVVLPPQHAEHEVTSTEARVA